MILAVLFDLDDTLIDRQAATDVFLSDLHLRRRMAHVPPEAFRNRFRELDEHGMASRVPVFRRLVKEYALDVSPDELEAEFRHCVWEHPILFPDARSTLAGLRAHGYLLGIITNGLAESQHPKLRATALAPLVDTVLISDEEGLEKPDPDIFRRAASRLAVDSEACMFVGDNPRSDVAGAASAGMASVWIRRYMPWPEEPTVAPHHTIDSLTQVLGLVPERLR